MDLRGSMTRIYHATLSASPDTRGMVSHRLKTISVVQFPKSKVKALVAMVLHSHFSQFLLFSESPMMLPNFLNHCTIIQVLFGQVDNQKRFLENSYPFVYFAAF